MLRDATVDDAEAIAQIYAYYCTKTTVTFQTVPSTAEEVAMGIAADPAGGQLPYLVAVLDGQVVGYSYATLLRAREGYASSCESGIYLKFTHRGRGIGSMLLAGLIHRCEALDIRQLVAIVAADQEASLALHKRFGFVERGRLEAIGYKHDRWLSTVQLQRSLGRGSADPPTRRL